MQPALRAKREFTPTGPEQSQRRCGPALATFPQTPGTGHMTYGSDGAGTYVHCSPVRQRLRLDAAHHGLRNPLSLNPASCLVEVALLAQIVALQRITPRVRGGCLYVFRQARRGGRCS